MKRLDRIREALQELNPMSQGQPQKSPYGTHAHISRTSIVELMDCLSYVCFPECSTPPRRVVPEHVEAENVMEWVLSHIYDTMTSQIAFSFILHGDQEAVVHADDFHPVRTKQRTPLDWSAPSTGALSLVQLDNALALNGHNNLNQNQQHAQHATSITASRHPCTTTLNGTAPRSAQDASAHNLADRVAFEEFQALCKAKANAIVSKFLTERLPHVRWLLHTDVEAIFRNDVAATSPSEVVLCYPGIRCMTHQRCAHQLHLLGVPTNFTRMVTEIAHSTTGIDIHPTTAIGHHFFIDHGTGVVVGATAIIGNYVSLYQGVTLGAKSFPVDKSGSLILNLPRHPILEDGVTVYANAVVLGRVTIGEGSTIGGNCWIVSNVPPHSSIVQKPSRMLAPDENMFLEKDGSGI